MGEEANGMIEDINNPVYRMLKEDYPDLDLDYVVLKADQPYSGKEYHQQAAVAAIMILNRRFHEDDSPREVPPDDGDFDPYTMDQGLMQCESITPTQFFSREKEFKFGNTPESPMKKSYWSAYSKPPYPIPYGEEGFRRINDELFPVAHREKLEILAWNDEFSSYFEDGKEWWGTGFWTILDSVSKRFVVIGASLTD